MHTPYRKEGARPRESVTVKPDFSDKPDCRPDDLFLPEPEARIFLPAPRLRRRHFLR